MEYDSSPFQPASCCPGARWDPRAGDGLRDRVGGIVPVRTSCRVTRAEATGSTVRLDIAGPGDAVETRGGLE